MSVVKDEINAAVLAEITRDIVVAAVQSAQVGTGDGVGATLGQIYADALKVIAQAQY